MVTQPEIMPCLWLWKLTSTQDGGALRRLPACQVAAWRQPRAERRTGERKRPGRSGRWRQVAAPGARCGRAARGAGGTTLRGPPPATRAPARPARRTTGSPGAAWSDAECLSKAHGNLTLIPRLEAKWPPVRCRAYSHRRSGAGPMPEGAHTRGPLPHNFLSFVQQSCCKHVGTLRSRACVRCLGTLLYIPGRGLHILCLLCCWLQACWIRAGEGKCTSIGCGHCGAERSAAGRMHRPLSTRYVATVSVAVEMQIGTGLR